MDKIASCRFVYLVRAEGDEQLDSTCLFVWRIPLWQRLQEGLSERFQRWRFAAVRSWSKDFRVNWKIHSGSAQVAFDHSFMSLFDITPSIELEIILCEIRDSTCDFALCCSCNLCSFSDSSRVLFAIRLSISICLWWVACQICCISWLMLFLRLNRFDRNNLECMNVNDWMPRPQEYVSAGIWILLCRHGLEASASLWCVSSLLNRVPLQSKFCWNCMFWARMKFVIVKWWILSKFWVSFGLMLLNCSSRLTKILISLTRLLWLPRFS